MMKVINQEKALNTVCFKDLCIGDVYKDECGHICVKVSDDCGKNNLTYEYDEYDEQDEWRFTSENSSTEVTPIDAELVIK